jgi:hypothetical protein
MRVNSGKAVARLVKGVFVASTIPVSLVLPRKFEPQLHLAGCRRG